MNVLLLANRDWANLGYILSKCLNSVGVKATMLVGNKHVFGYPEQGINFKSVNDVRKYAENADIIQFMHSDFVNTGVDLSKKRVFVFHGGGVYLVKHKMKNKIFNPIVESSIIQTGNLFGLGAKNEQWLLPAVDVDKLLPVYKNVNNSKLIIGHFPSSAHAKNSEGINKVIYNLKKYYGDRFEYEFSSENVSWKEQLSRVSRCDVYIEACSLLVDVKKHNTVVKYGEWGLAALEAAALGKIVITHFLSKDKYEKEYGECFLKVANSLDEIEKHLRIILSLNSDELLTIKEETREWVEKFHSYKAVGNRLKNVIYKI